MNKASQKFLKMPKKFYRVEPTIGRIGVSVADEIVCTFGPKLLPWSCPTAVTDGSGSSSTANYPPCTPVAVPKVELIALVIDRLKQSLSNITKICNYLGFVLALQKIVANFWKNCKKFVA